MFNVKNALDDRIINLVDNSTVIYLEVVEQDGFEITIAYKRGRGNRWKKHTGLNRTREMLDFDVIRELKEELLDVSLQATITGYVEFANDMEETDFISFEDVHPIIKKVLN